MHTLTDISYGEDYLEEATQPSAPSRLSVTERGDAMYNFTEAGDFRKGNNADNLTAEG